MSYPSNLPDKVPASEYLECAEATGWSPELVRALSMQESLERPWAIRFEKHVWRRYRFASRAAQAFDGRNPGGNWEKRWELFGAIDAVCQRDAAMFNPQADAAAILSHSFGWPQIMGFNHTEAGYEDHREFLADMKTIEGQRRAFINLVLADEQLIEAGRAGHEDFDLLGLSYNGKYYRRNNWHTRVRRNFERLRAEGGAYV